MGAGRDTDRAHVRLAELVAALSLGIDLGFGQPMEHVLRQCLIALRLAERDRARRERARRRLLHRAADQRRLPHRRPRAGQVVRRRHRAEVDQVRPRARAACACGRRACGCSARATRRCTASASGSSSRSPGHREVDGMIEHHAAIARSLARAARAARRRCSTPLGGLRAVGRARLARRLGGRGDPARRRGSRSWPSTSRWPIAWAGSRRRGGSPRERRGKQFDPALVALSASRGDVILAGLDASATWDAVIGAEPALGGRARGRASSTPRCSSDRELRRPQVAVHARPLARGCGPRRRGRRAARAADGRGAHPPPRRAGRTTSGGSACRTRSGTSAGPLGAGEWERVRHAPLPHRAHARASRPRSRRSARVAVQHHERLDGSGYPRGLSGAAISPLGAHPRRRRRLPGDARAAPAPPRARADEAAAELRAEVTRPGGWTREAVEAVLGAAGHRVRAQARGAGRPDRARGRGAAAASPAGCPTRRSPSGW